MNENNKKDYYLSVMICQIILSFLLTSTVYFFCRGSEEIKTDFLTMLSRNIESYEVENAVETIKKHLYTGEVFTVLNIKDDFIEATENNGTGGKDFNYKEAAQNTSFAPIFSTAEIVSPIEKCKYTSMFGYRINPISGEYSFHSGVDMAADAGTNIRAAFSGKVTKTGWDDMAGNYVYLSHDEGFTTFYCHCSEILVETGTNIRQGETIALVGSTGYSTGPHLHFEIRKDNIRYNPMWLLKK